MRMRGVMAAAGLAFLAGILFGSAPARAMALPAPALLGGAVDQISPVEAVCYPYCGGYGYRPYYRPYYARPYYRPYRPYYGYHRPYYRPYYARPYYGYGYYRPYYPRPRFYVGPHVYYY
jgi:hypothetical protein